MRNCVTKKNGIVFYSFFILFILFYTNKGFALEQTPLEAQEKFFLEFYTHNLLMTEPNGFFKLSRESGTLYTEIEKQLPENAYLLDVYVPPEYEEDLKRGQDKNITRMIYIYTMPLLLHRSSRMQNLQLGFIRNSFVSVLNEFNPLAALRSDTEEEKLAWEERVHIRLLRGDSVHFRYPRHIAKNGESEIYSMFQNYPLDDERNTGVFMSTYIFARDRQVYFISASSFLTSNEYYDELMWTRNSIERFVNLIVPQKIEIDL